MTGSTPRLAEGCCVLAGQVPLYAPPDRPVRERDGIEPTLRSTIQGVVNGLRPWPLVLLGEAGSGKTCAGLCMIDAFGGWYITLPELCEMTISAQQGTLTWPSGYRRTTWEVWDAWHNAHLVILDEIGARDKVSDHHYETLKWAMDRREGCPAVFITNHETFKELGGLYDDRIASRLSSGTPVWLKGDRRVSKGFGDATVWVCER